MSKFKIIGDDGSEQDFEAEQDDTETSAKFGIDPGDFVVVRPDGTEVNARDLVSDEDDSDEEEDDTTEPVMTVHIHG